ncbi:response regulator transcription factor [Rubrivirga marina]|nr:response regulator transcription factor [Rubrivirga marina]
MPDPFPSPDAPMWVLLIEDEARLADSVRRGLEEEGYRVDVAGDAEVGERLALENAYDAFVVDWRLPRGDGKTIVERVRAAGKDQPVLMLTALSDVEHRVAGLDAGADDYLPKPFAFEELVARLRALLRRPPLSDQKRTVAVGPLVLDGERRRVTMAGPLREAVLNLRPKEHAMLEVLMRSADAALSRTVLAERVWGDPLFVTDNALDVTVSGLRQRLADAERESGASGAPSIETIRGVGYRLAPADGAPGAE